MQWCRDWMALIMCWSRGSHALITWLPMHCWRRWSGTDHVAHHALIPCLSCSDQWLTGADHGTVHARITWLIMNWPHDWACSDHVADLSLITCLSNIDHVTERRWSRECAVSDHVADHALISWLSTHWSCAGGRWGIPLWTKVMRKEALHTQMRVQASGVHPDILQHLPPKKPESAYFIALCSHLWIYWGVSPTTILISLSKSYLTAPICKVPGQLGVFKSKPLRWLSNSPDKFTRTPAAMHTIVYSLLASRGTGSLRYSNSLEPLRELKTVRIN